MKPKDFAALAIKNGYDIARCNGWDWIKANLEKLDDIFQTKEYKACDGMKYKCMPLLFGNAEYSELEKYALSTAWYLNNQRTREKEKAEYTRKMIEAGWLVLTENVVKYAFENKKKLRVKAEMSHDWLTVKTERVYKPFVTPKGECYLMKPRARTRGQALCRFDNAFCKVIK